MARILIAEDEEVLRMLMVDTLEDEGHELDEAVDGQEAIDSIMENDYDLILLDYMMPLYTGLEVIEKVRNSPEKGSVKIMMVSAKSQQADRDLVLKSGADYFIAKPYSPAELVQRIEDILNEEN
ncbi:response regulator transcription factor [Rossellomorea vietnamensis]|jgi:DNA-binding response OmpR family regulator|uniref:Response regulator n=1 Tax=Rossellomorea vietnamensis TaxID=218284 RepID=A0A6I6UU54_9BACI|nr:response regulator [Rossellomorea vietnamensis]MCA0150637.1 response regulator [Rossellomorea vietnamensis]QHE63121.1 response regulator [Rossellomorea vietnamensis]